MPIPISLPRRLPSQIFFASIHGAEEGFFPETAATLQHESRLVNVPLPRGTGAAAYLAAFDLHVVPAVRRSLLYLPISTYIYLYLPLTHPDLTPTSFWLMLTQVRRFRPDLILISCGFDAHREDAPDLSGFLQVEGGSM